MNPKTFFEQFDTLAEAPNGIQRLRELILDMAVRGKLVPEDPEDEPAEKLLIKIHHQREELIEAKIIRKRSLEAINEDDYPYKVPSSWEWCMLCEIAHELGQKKPNNRFSYIDVSAIKNSSVSSEVSILNPEDAPSRARKIIKKGTVIYSTVRPYLLNIAVIEEDFNPEPIASTAFSILHPYEGVEKWYLYYALKSRYFIEYVELYQKGVAYPAISDTDLLKAPFPLPPLAEQKRIVAKVDELMALCDALEAAQQTRNTLRQKLRASALDGLMNAPSNTDLETAWAFVRDNWGLMCDRPEDVEGLRQVILQSAFRGALGTQQETDGNASDLVCQAEEERERLTRMGKIKASRKLPDLNPDEVPFALPPSWKWARLGNFAELITKGSSPKWQGINYVEPGEGIRFITSENVRSFQLDVSKAKYVESRFNEIEPRSILQKKDLLVNIVGASIGRAAVFNLDEVSNINQAVCLIRLISSVPLIDHRYILYFLNSPLCISLMLDKQVDNARANLSMGNLAKFPVPLPPLPEQKRIVAKVDELMKLCDQLEKNLRQQYQSAENFLTSILSCQQ